MNTSAATSAVRYGGFWRRLAALFLDFSIVLPVFALMEMARAQNRMLHVYLAIPWLVFMWLYDVSLVQRFGGTPGKRIMNLRIAMVDGSPVTGRAAGLRYGVDFVLLVIGAVAIAVAAMSVPDSAYNGLGIADRNQVLTDNAPWWSEYHGWAMWGWMFSEFVVLLTNRKRRALHDFIAGTVVVVDPPSQPFTAAPPIAREPAS